MSIIIKGMEMPKNCWLCPLSVLYEKPREMLRCKISKEEVLRNKIDSNCPLIKLPPHGRLIDADALGISYCNPAVFIDENYGTGWNHAIDAITNAPTILEEETCNKSDDGTLIANNGAEVDE